MSPTLWIIVLLIAMWPIMCSGRRKCAPRGSFFKCLFIAAILWGCLFFLRQSKNGTRIAQIVPHALQSIPSIRIAPNTTRVTTRPRAMLSAPVPPTTQISNLWIEDWPQFVNTTHWQGFRAESSDTCVTEAEARQEAINNAATSMSQLVLADPSFRTEREMVSHDLKNAISGQLQSGAYIADQIVRKIEKPYGTLYKSYLLIDARNSTVASLNQFARDALSQAKSNEMTTWASTAALFLVIVLLYAFLNAATKGYFVWKLRAAALMALIMMVLAMAVWMR